MRGPFQPITTERARHRRSASCCPNTARDRGQDRHRPLGDLAARRARPSPTTTCSPATSRRRCWTTRATASVVAARPRRPARRCRRTSPSPTISRRPGPGSSAPRTSRSPSAATRRSPTSASATSTSTPASRPTRLDRRRAFLAELDALPASRSRRDPPTPTRSSSRPTGWSPRREAKKAFDLSDEKPATRAPLRPADARPELPAGPPAGRARRAVRHRQQHRLGHARRPGAAAQGRLQRARRSGVGLVPTFDLAFAALVGDLSERGLLDETLVVAMGEFGRTPKLNTAGGRDHWPRVFSVVLAGGGVKGGQVIGASDRVGESPRDRPGHARPTWPAPSTRCSASTRTASCTRPTAGRCSQPGRRGRPGAARMSWLALAVAARARLRRRRPPPRRRSRPLAFTPDGKAVVVGSQAGLEVRSWPDLKPSPHARRPNWPTFTTWPSRPTARPSPRSAARRRSGDGRTVPLAGREAAPPVQPAPGPALRRRTGGRLGRRWPRRAPTGSSASTRWPADAAGPDPGGALARRPRRRVPARRTPGC